MTQYINLLNPAFRRRRELVSLPSLAVALVAVAAALAGTGFLAQQRADRLQREVARVDAQLRAEQERAVALGRASTEAKPDAKLIAEIEATRVALHDRQAALVEIAGGALGDTSGFSEQFRSFSRQAVTGLWLTGFTLSGAGREIQIQGRALQAEMVPAYIRRLGSEPVFRGQVFDSLRIEEGKADLHARPAPRSATGAAAAPATGAARVPYVEFRLVSSPDAVGKPDNVAMGFPPPQAVEAARR